MTLTHKHQHISSTTPNSEVAGQGPNLGIKTTGGNSSNLIEEFMRGRMLRKNDIVQDH